MVPEKWLWIAWTVADGSAAEAHRNLTEVPLGRLAEFYAIKCHADAVQYD